jgi:inward rectifier potassium channel
MAKPRYIPEEELRDLGFGTRVSQQSRLRLLNRDGSFNVRRVGLSFFQSIDLYHILLNLSWIHFFLWVFTTFCLINTLFATGYVLCGEGTLRGMTASSLHGRLFDAFFFSVETFTTIGYGHVAPDSLAGNILMTIEAFIGLIGAALVTGIVFARFSRPTARIEFSRRALIAPYREITAFEFRIANRRPSQLTQVEAKVLLSRMEDVGGTKTRRYYALPLERQEVVFFPLAWTIVHPIDEESPLYGRTEDDLRASEAEFLILITAIDDTFSQTVHTRTSYRHEELMWSHRFSDLFVGQEDGDQILRIDLRRLHDVQKV